MSWYFSTDEIVSDFRYYFEFNNYQYADIDLWNSESVRNQIPKKLSEATGSRLVISVSQLTDLLNVDFENTIDFLQNNKIIVYELVDSFYNFRSLKNLLFTVDRLIPYTHLHLISDAVISSRFFTHNLKNVAVFELSDTFDFEKMPRIYQTDLNKNCNSKDFMLTTVLKSGRPHRKILQRMLGEKIDLCNNAFVYFKQLNQPWIGHQSKEHDWNDGHPSMDLYRNAFLEVVPETLYKGGFMMTEKIIKPVVTKTPFLMVANCKYLEFLKQKGFKTFDKLIDESYDNAPRIEDRVCLMINTLQDIVKNGAKDFYQQSKDILDHNHKRFSELSGSYRYYRDLDYRRIIDQVESAKI